MNALVKINNSSGRFNNFEGISRRPTTLEPNETVWTLPANQGVGTFKRFDLTKGSSLSISQCKMKRKYLAQVDEGRPSLSLVFVLEGCTKTGNSCISRDLSFLAGKGYIAYLSDPVIRREIKAGQSLRAVSIKITPFRLRTLAGDQEDLLPTALLRIMEGGREPGFFKEISINSKLRLPLQQIFSSHYQGLVRRFFWESKVLELLAFTFEQIGELDDRACGRDVLSGKDRDLAYYARELLCSQLHDPPSLSELAESVGISHVKLNRVFKQAFGSTVFAFLRQQKLELAAAMLADGRMKITDVAYEAGFCSSSHFATCFFKHFGMQPNMYRQRVCGKKKS